ncbi:hypothetical protein Sjap_003017 [Stephania japonica]|uniref:Uncharacterized protein n=1 Tax=Stephania japonica TaxID=461633 RepID=A0AAP0KQ41_9MAGN
MHISQTPGSPVLDSPFHAQFTNHQLQILSSELCIEYCQPFDYISLAECNAAKFLFSSCHAYTRAAGFLCGSSCGSWTSA